MCKEHNWSNGLKVCIFILLINIYLIGSCRHKVNFRGNLKFKPESRKNPKIFSVFLIFRIFNVTLPVKINLHAGISCVQAQNSGT